MFQIATDRDDFLDQRKVKNVQADERLGSASALWPRTQHLTSSHARPCPFDASARTYKNRCKVSHGKT